MSIYRLERKQYINAPLQEVWRFFSNPRNLGTITPPYMNFRVTSKELPGEIFKGQLITYKVSPILGIPLHWETEITEVKPLQHFVDEQKVGPYKLWRHKHFFQQEGDKVLMTDMVEYELPLSFLGDLAHSIFVQRQLKGIFHFRNNKVEELFNKAS
jgi:ligand-binding SRPBCC domain-containing protein